MNKLIISAIIGILLGITISIAPLLLSNAQNKFSYAHETAKNFSTTISTAPTTTYTPETARYNLAGSPTPNIALKTANLTNIFLIIIVSLLLSLIISLYVKRSLNI